MAANPPQEESLESVLQSLRGLLGQGEHVQAKVAAKKATRRFPLSAQAWLLRGEALRLSNSPAEAILAYQQSIGIDPELLIAHDRLAWLHSRNQAWSEAAQHHSVLLERAQDIPPRILTEAGECLERALRGPSPSAERRKQLTRGVERLLERYRPMAASLSEKADRYAALCRIGRLCVLIKDPERAAEAFEQAVALEDGSAEATVGLAECLSTLGRDAEAVEHLRAAARTRGHDRSVQRLLERILAGSRVKTLRTIAFYLPQYHPIPENDRWWGKGFTEWTNVAAAQPLWAGHLQPRQPTALGYYDLRLPETANQQFELARKYGIDAFCYYYYWFNGRRLLDRPLNDLAQGRSGPFPFCICWVNEEWRRSWDGLSGEVLMPLEHTAESDFAFIKDVVPLLKHPDYVRVDGKPMLLVYRAGAMAEPQKTAAAWKDYCRANGLDDVYLCAVQSFASGDPSIVGFDAAVEFPPHAPDLDSESAYHRLLSAPKDVHPQFAGKIFDYPYLADGYMGRSPKPYPLHRTCMLAWDNTARRGKEGHVYGQFTVAKYEEWLSANVAKSLAEQSDAVVFINAWNEWAEGSALEPDRFFGYELLESTRRARSKGTYASFGTYWTHGAPQMSRQRIEQAQRIVLVGHDAHFFGAQLNLLNMARSLRRILGMEVSIILLEGGELVLEYEKVGATVVLPSGDAWREELRSVLLRYAALGADKAICNTVVSGEAVPILKECGYRVCGLVHELPSIVESRGWEQQRQAMIEGSDALLFASEVVKSAFTERFPLDASKLLVANQGIAFNAYWRRREALRAEVRGERGWPPHMRIVMGCGYGDTRKGIDLFVQAAAELTRRVPSGDTALLWVGGIDPNLAPYITADIKRLGLSERFHITGQVDDPARYFIGCDVFALTSREDPFPSVVMEAFDAGLPVVAFDGAGGYVDIVNDESGALVPYLDIGAFAGAVAELLRDDERRARIGSRNHGHSRVHFGYEPYLAKLLALLDGVPVASVARGNLARTPASRFSVSAIVPNYNYARYLELRLRTIFDQTLRPAEILILDDASTDRSVEIIEAMVKASPVPCRIIRNERNSGNPFAQWAEGLREARSELIWIAESDDYCEPMFLERLAPLFDDTEVALAFTDSVMVDAGGGSAGYRYRDYHRTMHGKRFDASFAIPGVDLLNECLFVNNVIPNASAALFRRASMLDNLSDLTRYEFSGDWWFWINIAQRGNVAYLDEPLNYHRRHDRSVMGDVLKQPEKLIFETIGFYKRILGSKDIVEPAAAQAMVARIRSMFGTYREQLGGERIESHPRLGASFAEIAGAASELARETT